MINIQALPLSGLIVCLTLIIGLYLIIKLARLEANFWDLQVERKKLFLKQGKIKMID